MTDSIRKGRTAVIYARVSTKGQADAGTSIETQLRVCRKWCEHEGVEIIAEFHDDGVSGTTTDRDAFSSMFGAIISKKPFYLVVYDSDRLTREGPGELDNLKAILGLVLIFFARGLVDVVEVILGIGLIRHKVLSINSGLLAVDDLQAARLGHDKLLSHVSDLSVAHDQDGLTETLGKVEGLDGKLIAFSHRSGSQRDSGLAY